MKVYAVEYNPNFDGSSVWSVQSLHATREMADRAMLRWRLTPITLDEVLAERNSPPKEFNLRAYLRHMRELRKDGGWDREFAWYRHWWIQATPEEYRRGFPAASYRVILRKLVERRRRSFYERQAKREHIPYTHFARSPEDGKLHLTNHLTPGEDLRVAEWEVEEPRGISDGMDAMVRTYGQLETLLCDDTDRSLTKEMACNAYLREAYELEVLRFGFLSSRKIEQYHDVCRSFAGVDYDRNVRTIDAP